MAHARSGTKTTTIAAVMTALATKGSEAFQLTIHDPKGGVYAGECKTGSPDLKTCEDLMTAVVSKGMSIVPRCNTTVSQLVGQFQCTDAKTNTETFMYLEQPATQTFNDYGNFIKDLLAEYQQTCQKDKHGSHWLLTLVIIASIAVVLYAVYRRHDLPQAMGEARKGCGSLKDQLVESCTNFCESLRDKLSKNNGYQPVHEATYADAASDDTLNDDEMADQHQPSKQTTTHLLKPNHNVSDYHSESDSGRGAAPRGPRQS